MWILIPGIVVNLIVSFGTLSNLMKPGSERMASILFLLMLGCWVLSVIGMLAALLGKRKLGGTLVITGSVIFVPIGLIAMIGARKVMNADLDGDLAARRKVAANISGRSS